MRVNWKEETLRWFLYATTLIIQTVLWIVLPPSPGKEWIRIVGNTLLLGGALAYCQLRKLPSERLRDLPDRYRYQ